MIPAIAAIPAIPVGPGRIVLLGLALIVYQRVAVAELARAAVRMARRLPIGRERPRRAVDATVRLVTATLAQLAFLGVLAIVTRVGWTAAFLRHLDVALLVYGVALGLGEMGLTTLLCRVAIHVAIALGDDRSPRDPMDWLVIARAGWMHQFLRIVEICPAPVVAAVVVAYVGTEEVIFRVVAITYLLPLGAAAALAASVALFVAAQVAGMPSWRTAMFPVISATAVGIVHGLLFLSVPNVIPLIIAHVVFFAGGALSSGTVRRPLFASGG